MEYPRTLAKFTRASLANFLARLKDRIENDHKGSMPAKSLTSFLQENSGLNVIQAKAWLTGQGIIVPSDESSSKKTTHWTLGPGMAKFADIGTDPTKPDSEFYARPKKTPALDRLLTLEELKREEKALKKEAGLEIDARLESLHAEVKRFKAFLANALEEIEKLKALKKQFQ